MDASLQIAPALEPVQIFQPRGDDRVLVVDTKPFHNQRVMRLYRTSDYLVAARVRDHWRIGNYDYFPGDLRFFP